MASNDSVSMAECMDINSEEAECSGWIEVVSRKKKLAEKAHPSQAALKQGDGYDDVRTTAQSRGVVRWNRIYQGIISRLLSVREVN